MRRKGNKQHSPRSFFSFFLFSFFSFFSFSFLSNFFLKFLVFDDWPSIFVFSLYFPARPKLPTVGLPRIPSGAMAIWS